MAEAIISSTVPPSNRSLSFSSRSSRSYWRLVCSTEKPFSPGLSEAPGDVVLGPPVRGGGEDLLRVVHLHQRPAQQERGPIRHPRRLLHVVGHDDHRILLPQLLDQLL